MAFKVSAKHIDPRWQMDAVTFADNCDNSESPDYTNRYKVQGCSEYGFRASAPNFGQTRNYLNKSDAIRALLADNGCTAINIERAA